MISDFKKLYQNRHEIARDWKRKGGRVFGYYSNYIPKEMIHAAGILPVQIRGNTESPSLADGRLQGFICSYMRTSFNEALEGKYGYSDGLIATKACNMVQNIYGIWVKNIKPAYSFYLALPSKRTPEAKEYYVKELNRFKESLERFCGGRISEDSLGEAIKIYNENRSLLKRLYQPNGKISLLGSDRFEVVRSGLVTPVEKHNEMLRKLLGNPSEGKGLEGKKRLLLSGNTFESASILRIIEEFGGDVAVDDLSIGTRWFWNLVDEGTEPLEALSDCYVGNMLHNFRLYSELRLKHLLGMIDRFQVRGVIFTLQKYCDTSFFEYPFLGEKLKAQNLPVLLLEIVDSAIGEARLRTRIQAFMEILE